MPYKTFFFCFSCIVFFACNHNRNPYENDLGIKPEHLAEIDTAHYTLIKWQDTVYNFGAIREGDSVNLKFKFTNIGKTLLFVFNAKTTCGCTITGATKDPVMPDDDGFVSATFRSSGQKGEVRKRIIVHTNTKNSPYSNLIIRGVVVPADNR